MRREPAAGGPAAPLETQTTSVPDNGNLAAVTELAHLDTAERTSTSRFYAALCVLAFLLDRISPGPQREDFVWILDVVAASATQ